MKSHPPSWGLAFPETESALSPLASRRDSNVATPYASATRPTLVALEIADQVIVLAGLVRIGGVAHAGAEQLISRGHCWVARKCMSMFSMATRSAGLAPERGHSGL